MKRSLFFVALTAVLLCVSGCGNTPKEVMLEDGKHSFEIKKVTDYLYETTLDYDFDYSLAYEILKKRVARLSGACSSVSIGNLRGRNLDWFYGNGAEFVVHTTKTANRHASIGVVPLTSLPNEQVNDGEYHPEFEILPYETMDGINDAGIFVNLNVVSYQEMGPWEMKTETTEDDLPETLGPRMILDNCGSLADIIPLYDRYDWISLGTADETHIMVSGPRSADDPTFTTAVFELIPFTEGGKTFRKLCCISPDEKDIVIAGGDASRFYHSKADPFIMTNFNLWKFEADKDRKGRLLSATEHPMGFERYETIEAVSKMETEFAGGKENLTDFQMKGVMRQVYYSNMYNLFTSNFWYTEDADIMPSKEELMNATFDQRNPYGDINKLIKGKDNKFVNDYMTAKKMWNNRDRNVRTDLWETVHTIIYNYKERSFQINVHEGTDYYNFKL